MNYTRYLEVGYNGRFETLEYLLNNFDSILSVYTGGPNTFIRNGRPQYSNSLKSLEKQIEFAHDKKIEFYIVVNAPCGFSPKSDKTFWTNCTQYFEEIEQTGANGVIVSHPFLIELVKSAVPKLTVVLSTIAEVKTARAAIEYERLGADFIVPSFNINFEIQKLEAISMALTTAKLIIMLNDHCHGDCPYRMFHYNHFAHYDDDTDYHNKCKKLYIKEPFRIIANNTIRPEDISKYFHICERFKLVTRMNTQEEIAILVNAYSKKKFEGNYVQLSDPRLAKEINIGNNHLGKLFDKKQNCQKICHKCNYCKFEYNKSQLSVTEINGYPKEVCDAREP